MRIRPLPPLLINQIAAGEVIERPQSVVKELVENSLDAGATRIEVVVEAGGRDLVRVSDNGDGIDPDQLTLALSSHATSKLETADDLAAVQTLGFRGEALASIASVSRMSITSRTTNQHSDTADSGSIIESQGGQLSDPRPIGCAPGTVVQVQDLFFNTPARRKFMRAASTEMGHITDWITQIALARSDVGFKLTHGTRVMLDVAAAGSPRERCVAVLGRELDEALLEFQETGEPSGENNTEVQPTAWGVAGLPAIARGSTKFQYLSVNGRPIKDRSLNHAMKEAYRGLIPTDKQPLVVMSLQIDPREVDVNAHPSKTEVRFRDPTRWHGLVLTALRQRLLGADLTPTAQLAAPVKKLWPTDPVRVDTEPPTEQATTPQAFVNRFRQMDPTQKGYIYQHVKQEMAQTETDLLAATTDALIAEAQQPATGIDEGHLPELPGALPGGAGAVLQVHDSYLVTQDDQGLVIIDQHALHERVMFEQLSTRILKADLESQRLLTPVIVNAGNQAESLLETLAPLLKRIGIEAELIGPGQVAIHAFPSFLFTRDVEPAHFVQDLLDRAADGDFVTPTHTTTLNEEAALHKVLDMMACKAAVKAGDRLTPDQLHALIAEGDRVERSASCPHGRPTTVRVPLKDMGKFFHRT